MNWTLNDRDVIVNPIPTPDCAPGGSHAAEVSSVAFPGNSPRARERIAVWVNVTEIATGAMLEFEVFVDAIHRLDMLLSTHVVGVEAYEILDLQGFDDKNNVFTTLVGLPFDWSIDLHNILKPVTFNETGGKVPKYYHEYEATGTDRFPVKGASAGKVHVNASLRDPYHPVMTQEIILVKEKLQIRPPVAYVTPQSEITYTLDIKRRENKMENGELKAVSEKWVPKKMPSDQYKWYLNNLTVGSIDRNLGTATGLALGFTSVTVNDTTLPDHFHSAKLYVVEPVRAGVRFGHGPCGDNKTYVIVNQTLEVTLELFDLYDHSLTITDNVELHIAQSGTGRVDLEETGLLDEDSTGLGWRSLGRQSPSQLKLRALVEGDVSIHVRLGRIFNSRTGETWPHKPLTASAPLVVSSPVNILSEGVILPVPTSSVPSTFRVEGEGGSGFYQWSSDDRDIMSTPMNMGLITAHKPGSAALWLADQCNPQNKASVPVEVSHPALPEFLPSPNEVQVNSQLNLHIGVVDSRGRRFSNCSSLILETSVSHDAIITKTQDPSNRCVSVCPQDSSRGCWTLTVRALTPGFVEVRASIPPQKKMALKPLAAFLPLQSPSQVILVVGSNVTFDWSFGPLPWPESGFKSLLPQMEHSPEGTTDMSARVNDALYQHVEGVTSLSSAVFYRGLWEDIRSENKSELVNFREGSYVPLDFADVTVVKTSGLTNQFTITCLDSTYEHPIALELRVGNTPSPQNRWPVVAKLKVKVTCYPRLQLLPAHSFLGLKTTKQLEIHAMDKVDTTFVQLLPPHPLLSLIRWEVAQEKVANITRTGLAMGLRLGQTQVRATLDLPELKEMSQEEITRIGLQEVALLTVVFQNFVIKTPTKHILQHQQTVVYLEGSNGEVPTDSAFEHIQAQWSVDSSVVELLPVLHSGVLRLDNRPVDGYSIVLRGRRPGTFVITVKVNIERPEAETDLPRQFTYTYTMVVLEPLTLLSPAFLLLPHGASATIVTSLDSRIALTYQALDLCKTQSCIPIVTVDDHGVVKARAPHTEACDNCVNADEFGMIVVSTPGADGFYVPSKHTHMSQTKDLQSVLIEVRAPSHLALRINLEPSGPLCVGSSRTVELVLQDRLGRAFHSLEGWDATGLKIEVNHPEIAAIVEAEAGRKALDVISVLNISALASNDHSSAVAKLWLANQPDVAPLYVRIETAPPESCVAPIGFRVRLHMEDVPALSDESARRDWEMKLLGEIAAALGTSLDRLSVAAVNPSLRFVDLDVAPARITQLHEDQWHLAVHDSSSRPPEQLFRELTTQLQDHLSVLRQGAVAEKIRRVEQVEVSVDNLGWALVLEANATATPVCLAPAPATAGYDVTTMFAVLVLAVLLLVLVLWVLGVGSSSRPPEPDRIDPRYDTYNTAPRFPAY